MIINPDDSPWESIYKLMIGSIVPRPIGWISTVNASGQPNLAPFSFFNGVCARPPHVLFCPMMRGTDLSPKDTLRNVRATGEFVANIVSESLKIQMNITSTEFPAQINEFEAAGLTPAPSIIVSPPRVLESAVQYECKVVHIVDLGSDPGGGSVVIGRVVRIHVRDDVLMGLDKIDLEKLAPIGRLAGHSYCRLTDIFELVRPPFQIPPKP